MVNINNDIPEPFREFLDAGSNTAEKAATKDREISAANIDTNSLASKNRTDMQDLLFLAAILMLCDD